MRLKRLTIVTLVVILLIPVLSFGQTWSDDQVDQAKIVLEEKFQLKESLSFNQEGALETETVQIFPALVEITDDGLDEGLTIALVKYGEETFLPLFAASIPELEPPYGFALMNEDGDVTSVGPVEIEGTEEGPENPTVKLIEEKEETYRVAFEFTEAIIRAEIPKSTPSA